MGDDIRSDRISVYAAYLADLNQFKANRQVETTIRVTVASVLLGGQAYIANNALVDKAAALGSMDLTTWVPIVAVFIIGSIGWYFCRDWKRLMENFRDASRDKYEHLELLERKYPELEATGAQLFLFERLKRDERKAMSHKQARQPEATSAGRGIAQMAKSSRRTSDSWVRLAAFFRNVFPALGITVPVFKLLVVLDAGAQLSDRLAPLWHTIGH